MVEMLEQLNRIAAERGQSLAQMAVAWNLKDDLVTSVIVGASSIAQIDDNLKALENTRFSAEELQLISAIVERQG
jgi:L-glyceraldehyde 3-phosphate reductase